MGGVLSPRRWRMNWRSSLLLTVSCLVILGIGIQERIPQDLAYFLFADPKTLLGIRNFFNVLSNLPFLVVGYAGMRLIITKPGVVTEETRTAWLVFFFGILLTAFGSGYFHLWPSHATLIWDRLPMTIGFMSLVAIIIADATHPAGDHLVSWSQRFGTLYSMAYRVLCRRKARRIF